MLNYFLLVDRDWIELSKYIAVIFERLEVLYVLHKFQLVVHRALRQTLL